MSDGPKTTRAAALPEVRRLGKNLNGYFGERIDIAAVLQDCLDAARAHGWTAEQFSAVPAPGLFALRRAPSGITHHSSRIYLSAGIHGDEPAAPLAVRRLLQENRWPHGLELWLCPCLNPAGYQLNRRENADGLDLNRQYLLPAAAEIQAHIRWLEQQPAFDLSLCLHEDWESHGFYVYELNPERRPTLAEAMVTAVAQVCPIDCSELIEGRPACQGVIRPAFDPRGRRDWPEAFYLLTHKTRLSYTLEAPSDFPLSARVAALVAAVNAALERIAGQGSGAG